jgi:hypothetical protein
MLKAADRAWSKLIKVIAWLEMHKATEVHYNAAAKMVSANLWRTETIDGKEVEGNLYPAMYYIDAILKLAPKPEQKAGDTSVANIKAGKLSAIQKIDLVMDLITANDKPALPKALLTLAGRPILEKLEKLRETLEVAINDDVLTLMHNLKEADDVNNRNDAIVNKITNKELDSLEDADMVELEKAQANA